MHYITSKVLKGIDIMNKTEPSKSKAGATKMKATPEVTQREHDHLKRRVNQLEKAQDHLRRTGQHLELYYSLPSPGHDEALIASPSIVTR